MHHASMRSMMIDHHRTQAVKILINPMNVHLNGPCAVAMSWMPRCEMERAASASSSVPISSITCVCGG